MNKKILISILIGILFLPAYPLGFVSAQLHDIGGGGVDIRQVVHGVENAAGLVFGGIAVVCFVIAGVLFLTSQGNAEKISQARSALLWGIAGVVVGIIAFSIIAIVESFLK